jgi:hypothetical protein
VLVGYGVAPDGSVFFVRSDDNHGPYEFVQDWHSDTLGEVGSPRRADARAVSRPRRGCGSRRRHSDARLPRRGTWSAASAGRLECWRRAPSDVRTAGG